MGHSESDSKRTFNCTEDRDDRLKQVCIFLFCMPEVPRRSYLRTELVELSIILKGPSVSIVKMRLVLVSLSRKKV